jgi:CRISPR/Cas system-associated exonuclease Cas4 (RecB family)
MMHGQQNVKKNGLRGWRWMEAAPYGIRCANSFSISNTEYSVTTTLVYLKKYAENGCVITL